MYRQRKKLVQFLANVPLFFRQAFRGNRGDIDNPCSHDMS